MQAGLAAAWWWQGLGCFWLAGTALQLLAWCVFLALAGEGEGVAAARSHHGRYFLFSDFAPADQRPWFGVSLRELMARAQAAVRAVLESEVNAAGLLDDTANAVLLPRQEWEIAQALADLTRGVRRRGRAGRPHLRGHRRPRHRQGVLHRARRVRGRGGRRPPAAPAVPAQGDGLLPGESRLARTVKVKRYPGKGSPPAGRATDDQARLSYLSFGGDWNGSRAVDPAMAGFSRAQSFDTEADWKAVIASGLVRGEQMRRGAGKDRLREIAGAMQDYRQTMNFDETARGTDVASQPVTVSGREGWVVVRRIRFEEKDVRATLDLSAMIVVDTGRPRASYLWIDIPDTHKRLWPDVNTLLGSVRLASG
ncbi:hypothetical protein [Actinomadura parmotrematis]|uniref:Uncharacterized protein n=1 Tax=Actinomadura parmotrematis TaxID=2864039 RepID=A0ABS7FPQ0_9ACTN|nr:hypothetical protein [Actinomadura parmotrematis]MBW8482384.1 hypothetical protein [Actinomadura parmotrematis]